MKLEVLRFNSSDDFTTGLLFDVTDNIRSFLCYTLEDEARTVKEWGETRIPSGKYKLSLRSEGGFHTRYLAKFGAEFHKGMIYVNEVPNFEYILWHIGNDDDDTAGCLLVGKTSQDNFIGSSTVAYKEIYPDIAGAIIRGDKVTATYIDYDGEIVVNNAKDHVMNIPQVTKIQEDIMDILSTEIKSLKTEVKALRQTIILKGLSPR